MSADPTELTPETSAFIRLLDRLPRGYAQTKHYWLENEMHPRRTGFRSEPIWIEQTPPIHTRLGDVIRLSTYVIVEEITERSVKVRQIVGDEILGDPDYLIIGVREP